MPRRFSQSSRSRRLASVGRPGRALVAVAAVATIALAGCGGSGSSASGKDATVTVDSPPNTSSAAAAYAASAGLFTKAGVDVTMHQHEGSQSTIVGLLSGSYPIVWATVPDILAAQAKGVGIQIVALGDEGAPGQIEVLSRGDSGITKPADLVGKKVAVPSPTSACVLAIPSILKQAGVDPAKVSLVTVPQVDHESTLKNKVADATCTPEPFQTELKNQLHPHAVMDIFSGSYKGMLIGAFVTTTKYAAAHPDVIAGFRSGLEQADAKANADPQVIRTLMPTYSGVDADIAKVIALPTYVKDVTATAPLEAVGDLMTKTGLLKTTPDLSTSFAPAAGS